VAQGRREMGQGVWLACVKGPSILPSAALGLGPRTEPMILCFQLAIPHFWAFIPRRCRYKLCNPGAILPGG
jgi:hypothetical protein